MHQPYYRDLVTGKCSMPWVRLHATKDYVDMVKCLERFPTIHQTFNVVPALLDQLEEYLPPANQTDDFFELSKRPADELSESEQRFLLQWFFLANTERMIKPYPRYHDLLAKRGLGAIDEEDWPAILRRFKSQDLLDLQVWFNLTWIDPWLRQLNPQLRELEQKGGSFTEAEKHVVLQTHLELIAQVIPTYRAAAEQGRIELSCSPYYHPIMPLLCDVRSAKMALPSLPLPEQGFQYQEDARWQLTAALARHHQAFGHSPQGMWPPEGSVSEAFVQLAMESNVRWIATDEAILWRTLKTPRSTEVLYRPHLLQRPAGRLAIVFRDRELSDLIGFVYSRWDPRAAAEDFLKRLEKIHQRMASAKQPALVSIILDGENAWESYPQDGAEFLTQLYGRLAADPRFRCVTISEFLHQYPLDHADALPELFAGSWIDGNFATWIGQEEKNTAWTHLTMARQALSDLIEQQKEVQRSLGAAEGSDWMWWFGDTHFSVQAEEFDRLFRMHLANSFRLAGRPIPSVLERPIRRAAARRLQPPTAMIHPTIDGRETTYYEWLYAGWVDLRQHYAALHRGAQYLRRLSYGFDDASHYFRLDVDEALLKTARSWSVEFLCSNTLRIRVTGAAQARHLRTEVVPAAANPPHAAFDRLLELAVPKALLHLQEEQKLELVVTLSDGTQILERYPSEGAFELLASPTDLEPYVWSA
jgi:alpha-amylase/alpha-mannosidase (GH57 family)